MPSTYEKVLELIERIGASVTPYSLLNPYRKFCRDGGNILLTEGFNLNSESVVVDFGGYHGDWSYRINTLYAPQIYIVEPISQFFGFLEKRFAGDSNVTILPFAVGRTNTEKVFYISGDATGLYSSGPPDLVKFDSFLSVLNLIEYRDINLASLNIEGGEYDLLDYLIEDGHIMRFQTLLVQFHNIDSDSLKRYEKIKAMLLRTHDMSFSYPFVWQRFDRQ